MLANTFCHIPGIGEKTERRLWSSGITSWELMCTTSQLAGTPRLRPSWTRHAEESRHQHASRNLRYFAERLPSSQAWRLFKDAEDSCAFLDIETTGLVGSEITTAALYDGESIRYYVNGDNLQQFADDLQDYRLLVTYNGKCFDLPCIEHYFGRRLNHAHIDLRYPLHSLGIRGGLKACEKQLGIRRPGLEDVDGFVAVLLWHEYRTTGSRKALETLLAYNILDAVNLHALMVRAYNKKLEQTPFADSYSLVSRPAPPIPFEPHADTVERVTRGMLTRDSFASSN